MPPCSSKTYPCAGVAWAYRVPSAESGYHGDSRGWGWNLFGTALAALGVEGITDGLHCKDPGSIFGGAVLFLAGLACDGVALVEFSNYAEEGRIVLSRQDRVSVEPLWLNPRDRSPPGLRMSYRF